MELEPEKCSKCHCPSHCHKICPKCPNDVCGQCSCPKCYTSKEPSYYLI